MSEVTAGLGGGMTAGAPCTPSLVGRWIRLRPVFAGDTPFLYELATSPNMAFRWRYRGEIVPLEVFTRDLWKEVLVQLVVESRSKKEPIGLVAAYSPDMKNGTVHLGVVLIPGRTRRGIGAEAGGLFVDYLFRTWNFRKLYGYTPGWNLDQFAEGANRAFREEGRLVTHEYYDGRYWDLHIMALYRADWEKAQSSRNGRQVRWASTAVPSSSTGARQPQEQLGG